ncbi:MAG: T9SS type A sorting domain-containing protein [Saprospiraceae bacterium]|nr:T9SS type A sorting domain-containing protein [Saprospiraceae bacterium]
MKGLIVFTLIFSSITSLWAQPTFNIRTRLGFPAATFSSVIATDSCYFVTGIIADTVPPYRTGALFAKFDLDGNPTLVKTLTSTTNTYATWRPTLLETQDGLWVSGYAFMPDMRGILIHYNQDGDTLDVFPFFNYYYPAKTFISPQGMAITADKFVVASDIESIGLRANISLVCMDKSGAISWNYSLGGNLYDWAGSIITSINNNYLVGGRKTNSGIVFQNYISQTWLFEIDTLGQMLWQYLSPLDSLLGKAKGLYQEHDGSIVVATSKGWEDPTHPTYHALRWHNYIFKLDADRQFDWGWELHSPFYSSDTDFNKLIACNDGSGYVAAGLATIGTSPTNGIYWGRVSKVSPQGDSIWDRHYAFPIGTDFPFHELYDIKETPDGGFILCGQSVNNYADSFPQQGWLLKLDAQGCLVPGCGLVPVEEAASQELPAMLLYPNPASDWLSVHLGEAGAEGQLRIVDMQGHLVLNFEAPLGNTTYVLPLTGLPPGIYTLQWLRAGRLVRAEQLVVAHK